MDVWLFSGVAPNTWADIQTSLERKIEARLQHRTQTADAGALSRAWCERAGLVAAEAFVALDLD